MSIAQREASARAGPPHRPLEAQVQSLTCISSADDEAAPASIERAGIEMAIAPRVHGAGHDDPSIPRRHAHDDWRGAKSGDDGCRDRSAGHAEDFRRTKRTNSFRARGEVLRPG